MRRLEANLRESKMQLSNQKGKLQSRNSDDDTHRNLLNQKNAEINRYVEEIGLLSSDNNQMSVEIEEITAELEVTLGEIEKNTDELETLRASVQKSDERIDQLIDERDSLRIKVEDLSDQLESKGLQNDEKYKEIEKKSMKYRDRVKELEQENSFQIAELKKLKGSLEQLRHSDEIPLLDALKKEVVSKGILYAFTIDVIITDLRSQLEDSIRDFELLAKDWDQFDSALKERKASQTPITQGTETGSLKDKINMLRAKRKEDSEKIKSLIDQVAEREASIVELETMVQKFESGAFGLKEAILEIKQLKSKLRHEDDKAAKLTQEITHLESQGADFAEENFYLRAKLDLPPTEIDISNFKRVKAVELEQTKALNHTLQGEIDHLEEERLQLKSQLRLRALDKGERAIDMGLDAADLYAVEEYADALRSGDLNQESLRPSFKNSVINKLIVQIEHAHNDSKEYKGKMAIIEKKLLESTTECELLESAIMEMSKSFVDPGTAELPESLGMNLPQVQHLIAMLQGKYTSNNPKISAAVKDAEASKINFQVKKEIASLKEQCASLKKQSEKNYMEVERKNMAIEALHEELQLVKESRRGSRLSEPAEELITSSVGFVTLLDQLIDCLSELEENKDTLSRNKLAIEEYQKKLVPLCVKTRLLYRDFAASRAVHLEEMGRMKKELAREDERSKLLQHQIDRYSSITNDLNLPNDSLKAKYVSNQRKLVVAEVSEMSLKRRTVTLEASERNLEKEKAELEKHLFELDQTARQTISRLYQFKNEAQIAATEFGQKYEESVPLGVYKVLENKLIMYVAKAKVLLERERDEIDIRSSNEHFRIKNAELEERLMELELHTHEIKAKAIEFDKMQLKTEPGDYLADQYWRPKYASLGIKAEVLEKRAQMAEQRLKSESATEGVVGDITLTFSFKLNFLIWKSCIWTQKKKLFGFKKKIAGF